MVTRDAFYFTIFSFSGNKNKKEDVDFFSTVEPLKTDTLRDEQECTLFVFSKVQLVAVIARNRVQLPKKFRRVNLKQRNQTSP